MKKLILIAAAVLGFAAAVSAQPRSVGIRGGYGGGVTFQNYMFNSSNSFLEAYVGVDAVGDGGFMSTLTYNWPIARPTWGRTGDWTWYLGPGVAFGYVYNNSNDDKAEFMTAILLEVQLEWLVSTHFAMSADIKPMFGYHFGDGAFYDGGLYGLIPSLGIKYVF
jgi:hypothetical protein